MVVGALLLVETFFIIIPPLSEGGGGYTVLPLSVHPSIRPSVLPSIQDIFRHTFLSNCWWQKSDMWSQASYRYTILWVAFLDPSDSYFLFADLVGFYTHWTYMHIFSSHFSQQLLMAEIWYLVTSFIYVCHIVGSVFGPVRFLLPVCRLSWFLYTLNIYAHFFVTFFSATIDGRDLIFGHKLHIGTPYRGKRFWTLQIPTSCLPKSGGIISEH